MKEEFLKFKGKMCWLYLNHEVLDEITIYRGAVEHFNEKKYAFLLGGFFVMVLHF